MGYTHYWRRPTEARRKPFIAWAEDVRRLVEHPHGIPLAGPDGVGPPAIVLDAVAFNGVAGDAHEDFWIERVSRPDEWERPDAAGRYLEFCKTDRKPYDLIVCAALIRLHAYFPAWPIWSDGSSAEWWPAVRLCGAVFSFAHGLPPGVRTKGCDRCPIGLATHAGPQYPGGPWVELCDDCWPNIPVTEV